MKSIYDKLFKYRPSCNTDVGETFKRIKRELEAEKKRSEQIIEEAEQIVAKTRIRGKVA